MTGTDRKGKAIDGPIVRLWHVLLMFLLFPAGIILGSMVESTQLPLPVRGAAGLAVWLSSLAGLLLLRRWTIRLDEFQQQIVWQSVGWAGIWTVIFIVAMSFYTVLVNGGSPLGMIGGAPGLCAWVAAMMIMMQEGKARRATAGARESER